MKRRVLYISALMLSLTGSMYAQGEMDAYKLSQTDLLGTARSVGMGGAVGAMGGDISAISVNPAGIGYFSASQVVTTLNFQNVETKSHLNAGDLKDNKFKFNFNNLAFVGIFPIDSDITSSLNFGFSFNRLKNFDRKYGVQGNNVNSIAGYMAASANLAGVTPSDLNLGNYPFRDYDWMSIFGYNSGFIVPSGGGFVAPNLVPGSDINSGLFVEEKGYVDTYDFNFGTTLNEIISLGLTVSVTDMDYRRNTYYGEDYDGTEIGFGLSNFLKTEGTGVQVAAGVIVQPIPEFRFGLSYHSPTWYSLTDYYDADMNYTNTTTKDGHITSTDGGYNSAVDYDMRTPDKFTFSATGMLGPVLLSADYEFTNYKSNMRYRDSDGWYDGTNSVIKEDFKGASAVRVGAEISFTKQFTGRLGYAWKESPIKKKIMDSANNVITVGSDAHYVLDKDTHNITWGLGYRFTKNIFADIAFIYKMQDADLYAFSGSNKATMKNNTFNGMMTFGYRF